MQHRRGAGCRRESGRQTQLEWRRAAACAHATWAQASRDTLPSRRSSRPCRSPPQPPSHQCPLLMSVRSAAG